MLARFGLVPVAADLPEIRRLIQSEIADDERESNEPLKTLCIQLFSAGVPSDALLIWKAKTSDFDAGFYIDIHSSVAQNLDRQIAALRAEGCDDIYREKASGKDIRKRPQLEKSMRSPPATFSSSPSGIGRPGR